MGISHIEIARMGVVKEEDFQAVVSRVYVKYLNVTRKLQTVYDLEPGSSRHGFFGRVPNWTKVNGGLLKMYKAEMLESLQYMHNFQTGSLLQWNIPSVECEADPS
ncbi:hypothetical protein MKW98_013414 [Papaver atlanticum]|uniref:Serine/threonine-protein phosphatase 2A activator n=1 Tax=Papaver atlanticum TaxID=357466 RepID=A0AAD4SUE7_9MAGN|nr:hypothetical protein MKW98_013414 [Papaver atlanticum]